MTSSNDLGRVVDYVARLESLIEQLDRRLNNIVREAVVEDIDPERARVKVKDAGDLKSSWVPWMEIAGGIRTWDPPAKGQRVTLVSPSGEPGQGFVIPGGFSDDFAQPSSDPGESLKVIGDSAISMTSGRVTIRTPHLVVEAGQVDFNQA